MSILGESFSVMGIGLVMVFLGLIILIAFVYLIAAALGGREKKDDGRSAEVSAPAAPAPAPVPVPAPVAAQGLDPQVVAVIAAAVAAMDANGKPLVIRSIRRAPGWNRAARTEQVYRF